MSGSFISPELRARVRGLMAPIAVGLGRLGFTPNGLTLVGFGIAIIARRPRGLSCGCRPGSLSCSAACFDLFDGASPGRRAGRAGSAAFMDSTFDRWGEGVVYVGIVSAPIADLDWPPSSPPAADDSAFMVSYTRAKAENQGLRPAPAWPRSASPRARSGSWSSPSACCCPAGRRHHPPRDRARPDRLPRNHHHHPAHRRHHQPGKAAGLGPRRSRSTTT